MFTKPQLLQISRIFWCEPKDIRILRETTGGMTNSNVLIEVRGQKYVVRLPGAGSEKLVDRAQEYKVYAFLKQQGIDDITVYYHTDGLKITKYIDQARNAVASNQDDTLRCMAFLKRLHHLSLKPNINYFSMSEAINKYIGLSDLYKEAYSSGEAKELYDNIIGLIKWTESIATDRILCHIDPNPDNFVFHTKSEMPMLLDWEYASLQDPHLDIAMWAVYSNYSREQFDLLIDTYFEGQCSETIRMKIYALAAQAGFLWYNWCIYKEQHDIYYGEYTENQYKYAVEYSKIVLDWLSK